MAYRKFSSIFSILSTKITEKRAQLASLAPYGHFPISQITVSQLLNGQKDVKSILCETSKVEYSGIHYRNYPISQVLSDLPGIQKQPSVESLLYFFLTSEVPSYDSFHSFKSLLHNPTLPPSTESLLLALPKETHPMTQFSIAVTSLSQHSKYSAQFHSTPKADLWLPMLEDCLFLLSNLPKIAALIYRGTFRDGKLGSTSQNDLAENFSRMLGWKDEKFFEAIRLFLVIHADHEGGNASTHASRLVASAGANIFEAFAAGLNSLAGPIHGMGMQNCLMWLVEMWRTLGESIDEQSVEIYLKLYLKQHDKLPGFGHPVLRSTDERFLAQLEFSKKQLSNDPLCELIQVVYKVGPKILREMGHSHQFANMYLHSAAILFHYGLRMYEYYCVLFGLSRSIGIISNVVWDVALQLPVEEPESITLEELERIK